MNTDTQILKVVQAVEPILQPGESIVMIRLADPLSASHADYFTRYKVGVGKINGSASGVTDRRCVVVQISSNTGKADINVSTQCESIGDIG